MNEKINAIKKFIKTYFTEESENIAIVTANQFLRLLNEFSAIQKDENARTVKIKLELEYSMGLHLAMNPLKMTVRLLSIIADPNVYEITRRISSSYHFRHENINENINTSHSISAIRSLANEIRRYFIKDYQLFCEQLKDINIMMTEFMKVEK